MDRAEAFRRFVGIAATHVSQASDRASAALDLCRSLLSDADDLAEFRSLGAKDRAQFASALVLYLMRRRYPDASYDRLVVEARARAPVSFKTTGFVQRYLERVPEFKRAFDAFARAFAPHPHTALRIAIAGSGPLNYVRKIRDGFIGHLDVAWPGWTEAVHVDGESHLDPAGWRSHLDAIRLAESVAAIDVLVAIGTQAALMLHQTFGPAHTRPFLFLGVTDPEAAGLVHRLDGPHPSNLSGVAYGRGADAIVGKLRFIFPGRRLHYVYSTQYPQDHAIAQRIACVHPDIEIKPFDDLPTLAGLTDPSGIYFSWFTFDLMFESLRASAREILEQRTVVTTTLSNIERNPYSPVAIGCDDRRIGIDGAAMLVRTDARLTAEPVHMPALEHRINPSAAARRELVRHLEEDRFLAPGE